MRADRPRPTCKVSLITLFFLLFLGFNKVSGQAGSPDLSFGDSGKTVTNFHNTDRLYASVVQLDDKIVVAGTTFNDSTNVDSFALVRYLSNGKIDPSFGNGGKVTTSLGIQCAGRGLLLQKDGKFVAVGNAYVVSSNNYDFALVRYLSNGSVDQAFGINGKVTVGLPQATLLGYCAALQGDGKIVAGGGINGTFSLIRFFPNGSVDSTFGQNGISRFGVSLPFTAGSANSVIVQADGKIVGVSGFDSLNNHGFFVARFLSNGVLDSSFGNNGHLSTILQPTTPYYSCYASDVKQQADGKLVVCGTLTTAGISNSDFAVVRYQGNGSTDSTFGINGKVVTDFGGKYDDAYSVAIQPDNKIIVAGDANQNIFSDFAMVRYQPNGELDTTFGKGGREVVSEGRYYDFAQSVNLQSDGKIILAGYGDDGDSGDNFIVARFNSTDIVLPITKITLSGADERGTAVINWQTCNENNSYGFYIEKSADGNNWSAQGLVLSKGNINGCGNNYSFLDISPLSGNNYYRLRQVDLDGRYTYSKIVEIGFLDVPSIKINPNPVTDILHIRGLEIEGRPVLEIVGPEGKIVKSVVVISNSVDIDVSSLPKGLYFLRIGKSKNNNMSKFIKQ